MLETTQVLAPPEPSAVASVAPDLDSDTTPTESLRELSAEARQVAEPVVQELFDLLQNTGLKLSVAVSNAVHALKEYFVAQDDKAQPRPKERIAEVILEAVLDGFTPLPHRCGELSGGSDEIRAFFEKHGLWDPIVLVSQSKATKATLGEPSDGRRKGEIPDGIQMYGSALPARYEYRDLSEPYEAVPQEPCPIGGETVEQDSATEVSPKKSEEKAPIPDAIGSVSSLTELGVAVKRIGEIAGFLKDDQQQQGRELRRQGDLILNTLRSLKALADKWNKWVVAIGDQKFGAQVTKAVEVAALTFSHDASGEAIAEPPELAILRFATAVAEFGKTFGLDTYSARLLTNESLDENETLAQRVRKKCTDVATESERFLTLSAEFEAGLSSPEELAESRILTSLRAVHQFTSQQAEELTSEVFAKVESAAESVATLLRDRIQTILVNGLDCEETETSPPEESELEDALPALAEEEDDEDLEEHLLPTPQFSMNSEPSGQSASASFDDLYDALVNARVPKGGGTFPAPWVRLQFQDGRHLEGYCLFNEFRATGRLVNPDEEYSRDYHISEIARVSWWA